MQFRPEDSVFLLYKRTKLSLADNITRLQTLYINKADSFSFENVVRDFFRVPSIRDFLRTKPLIWQPESNTFALSLCSEDSESLPHFVNIKVVGNLNYVNDYGVEGIIIPDSPTCDESFETNYKLGDSASETLSKIVQDSERIWAIIEKFIDEEKTSMLQYCMDNHEDHSFCLVISIFNMMFYGKTIRKFGIKNYVKCEFYTQTLEPESER